MTCKLFEAETDPPETAVKTYSLRVGSRFFAPTSFNRGRLGENRFLLTRCNNLRRMKAASVFLDKKVGTIPQPKVR